VRARQQHFLTEFRQKHGCISDPEVLKTALSAFSAYASKNLPLLEAGLQPDSFEQESGKAYASILEGGTITGHGTPGDNEAKIKMHINTLSSASKALIVARENPSSISDDEFYGLTGDVLQQYLDSIYSSSIDPEEYGIFTKLTQHWERRFNEDLRSLNCLLPDIVTRVSEYIPENVAFVERIVNKGFAYTTPDGSVYFDIKAFEAAGHNYARLEPWNRNDKELLADGEGSLTKKLGVEKRSDADFALWKSSKPGEPSWPSPWGRGRPGWHIECSAMCSKVLGGQIDIHSGGIDLAFPHHDNELAQSEAYWAGNTSNCTAKASANHQWVNYFLHMGHLSISGSKMSKSLKNFTTIRNALEKQWTARGLRIVFLLGGWKERIEVTDDVASAARAWEASVNVSFHSILYRGSITDISHIEILY
jgi:cysteinyl-tRNA synthetase